MPVEMAIPFALGPDGSVAMVSDPLRRAVQRVVALVGTRPTEKIMDADFGVPLDSLVFEPDTDVAETELQDMVENALARYEPGITLLDVTPVMGEENTGVVDAKISIELTEDPITGTNQFVNTATIYPGGTVREIIRG